jgi:hypothetical protein
VLINEVLCREHRYTVLFEADMAYRYSHAHTGDVRGKHTVGEGIRATAFAKMIKFSSALVLNGQSDRTLLLV